MFGLFTITASNGTCGCSEFAVPCSAVRGDFVQWAIVFQRLKGMTAEEGMAFIHHKQETWGDDRVWLAESALIHMEHRGIGWDRAYLFDHSQAYVAF
ncbi:hypothetical protein [Paenibacillus sp. OV219]|uniref:hypothetical protein n=1 Tax=Paenibacillus sp. OV219 TaxID=1884377 RepID=UPI0008CB2CA6|nr:hypothetical protein [Paenibacillus sp. OV219]SEP14003.1 hypothetical protein SAMN05518847_11929 [Paenibacillus sp. OV219]